MKVYTVIAMDDFSKRLSLEPYTSLELALMRSFWIAKHIYGLTPNENPQPQKTGFATDVEYVVFQDDQSVLISVLEQDLREALPHFRGDHKQNNIPVVIPPPPIPVDDPRDPFLPAGWLYDGTPVKMDVLLSDPASMKDTDELTIAEQFALTIARISKRPNFSFSTNLGVFVQSSALKQVKDRTGIGYDIVNKEMELLREISNEELYDDLSPLD